jgi:hemoglobin
MPRSDSNSERLASRRIRLPHEETPLGVESQRRFADTINEVEEHEVHSAIGDDGFTRLVAAFYRQVPGDDILGPIYPAHDLRGAEERLRDFLIFRFGGPPIYIEQRGHPRLRMRHAPFAIGQVERDRWIALMNRALNEAVLPDEVRQILSVFFKSTATFLMNRPSPGDGG